MQATDTLLLIGTWIELRVVGSIATEETFGIAIAVAIAAFVARSLRMLLLWTPRPAHSRRGRGGSSRHFLACALERGLDAILTRTPHERTPCCGLAPGPTRCARC